QDRPRPPAREDARKQEEEEEREDIRPEDRLAITEGKLQSDQSVVDPGVRHIHSRILFPVSSMKVSSSVGLVTCKSRSSWRPASIHLTSSINARGASELRSA